MKNKLLRFIEIEIEIEIGIEIAIGGLRICRGYSLIT
jgi:hypothetical protein